MELSGKTVAVLGGSGDIGRGIALRLACLGADVSMTGRTLAKLDASADLILRESGKAAAVFAHDLRQEGEPAAFIEETVGVFGGLDILVTCAGDFKRGELTSITQNDWRDAFALMFIGAVAAVTAAWPHLRRRKGRVVMISGMHGREPHAKSIVSGPICAALLNFAKGASQSAKHQGMTVNCIVPGWIYGRRLETWLDKVSREQGIPRDQAKDQFAEQIGLNRFGTTDDVANIVELLVSDRGSYIQGAAIALDGGQTCTI